MSTKDETKIRILELEHSVWRAVIEKNGSALSNLFSDDYLEITHRGQRVERETVVEQSPLVDEIEEYNIQSEKIIELSENAILLNYHLTLVGTCNGIEITPKDRWTTSIWTFRNDSWKCAFFQQSSHQSPNAPK